MQTPIIGYNRNFVGLVDHHPQWAVLYAQKAAELSALLGDRLLQIDHFGSTAIPAIKAKPVIDILVQTATGEADDEIMRLFATQGYQVKTFPERKEKLFFFEENGLRLYNVHLTKHRSEFSEKMLLLRDTLNANETLAKRYEAIKLQCAQDNPHDSQAYYNAKKHFFKEAIGWGY